MITVNYAHICEKAFLAQNGNLNLIGIFERVATQNFPMVFPQLSIVTSLSGEVGEHQMTIKVLHEKEGKEINKPITLNITIQPPKGDQPSSGKQNLRIIGDINNLKIEEAGTYLVEISLNEKKAYTIPFSVHKVTKPIPENR